MLLFSYTTNSLLSIHLTGNTSPVYQRCPCPLFYKSVGQITLNILK